MKENNLKQIKIKCPAKINLDLRVFKKDKTTPYHKIKSVMQAISLFDYLTIKVSDGDGIKLDGTSDEITYDEKNICYKAVELFLNEINEQHFVEIFIEKNIPVAAGLAGGSTDAAGTLYGLNKLFNNVLSKEKLNDLAKLLGSDLNFCLIGGTKLCTGRGETITNMPFFNFKLSLIKPRDLKISTADAYRMFDEIKRESNLRNDLEFALLNKGNYPEIQHLHDLGMQMSGSGPTFFVRESKVNANLDKKQYLQIENLQSVEYGVSEVEV